LQEETGVKRLKMDIHPDIAQNPVLQRDLVALLDSFKCEMASAFEETSKAQMSRTAAQIVSHIQTTEQRLKLQHQSLANIVIEERVRTSQLEAEQDLHKAQVEEMQSALAIVQRAPAAAPGIVFSPRDERLVDDSIIRVTCAHLISLEELTASMDTWLSGQGNAKDTYEVRGGILAKRFTIAFKGANGFGSTKS
jgi:hypothetical protein